MDRVRKQGRRVRSDFAEVRTLASPLSYPRVGIVVPRFGRTVVERNRLRRRLREIIRIEVLPVLPPQDVLFRADRVAYKASYAALQRELLRVTDQLLRRA